MGGAENGVVNLMNGINTEIFMPIIISLVNDGPLKGRLDTKRVTLYEMGKKEGNDFFLPFRLYGLFKKIKPHVVHTHCWGTLVEGVTAAKLAGVPIVIHGEHGTIETKPRNLKIQRWFWKRCDSVLSISEALKQRLSTTVGVSTSLIKAVQNGVDIEKFSYLQKEQINNFKQKFNIPEDAIVIGTVGRLVPVKDQKTLIEAAQIIKEKLPGEIAVVIVGDGPLMENLQGRAAELGVYNIVYFLGRQENISEVMNSFDIFVLPSLSEGISNTILEAMACGLPIIATEVGGSVEIVKDGEYGFFIAPGNKNALASAILKFANDAELRDKFGRNARKTTEEKFSLQSMVNSYEKIYLDLLNQKGLH
jgi:sugar transferase (PEP-CTERM/EpsH1 system associated)